MSTPSKALLGIYGGTRVPYYSILIMASWQYSYPYNVIYANLDLTYKIYLGMDDKEYNIYYCQFNIWYIVGGIGETFLLLGVKT